MKRRLWWSWALGVLLAASACSGGAAETRRTDMLCGLTRGSCQACDSSLQQWCSDDEESRDEARAALCIATAGACSVCEATLDEYCGGP